MPSNENIVRAAVITTTVGVAIIKSIKTTRQERAKRVEIQQNMHKDIAAIHAARDEVLTKIDNGDYPINGGAIPAIMSDLQFYRMIHRED